ncbi:jg8814, partial [Pararge aegeria aegeria]
MHNVDIRFVRHVDDDDDLLILR